MRRINIFHPFNAINPIQYFHPIPAKSFSSQKTFLFYDLETTGLNPVFDMAHQFAAMAVDHNLNPIEKPYEWRVSLRMDTTPHPKAIFVNGHPPRDWYKGESEYSFYQKAHVLFNTPNTISTGYNSLDFDDQMMRFGFFRNLLSAYSHQHAQGCGRADLYPIALMYYAFGMAPAFHWPTRNNKPSFKLADLKEANDLADGTSHDALVDVHATLGLARKFKEANPDFWEGCLHHYDKANDKKAIHECETTVKIGDQHYSCGFIVKRSNRAEDHFLAPVVLLGRHAVYTNQTRWLRLDTGTILKKKDGALPFFIAGNLEQSDKLLSANTYEAACAKLLTLQENPSAFEYMQSIALKQCHESKETVDAYAMLYETGFPTKADETLFAKFHQAPPHEKMAVANEITNPVYHELAIRIIGHHFPKQLDEAGKRLFYQYLESTLNQNTACSDYKGSPFYSLEDAYVEFNDSLNPQALNSAHKKLYGEYKGWIETRINFFKSLDTSGITPCLEKLEKQYWQQRNIAKCKY